MEKAIDYWFSIEPYVFVGITSKCVILYNTLDGVIIESSSEEVLKLMQDVLKEENCGVILLKDERYQQEDINSFISEIREKYMGDKIEITYSSGKPVQLIPFCNYHDKQEIYKKHNFSSLKNVLENLYEISIHVDLITDVAELISFLQSIPGSPIINVVGNISEVVNNRDLLSYLNQRPSPKNIICNYNDVIVLQPTYENNFSYQILVNFPIDFQKWNYSRNLLLNQTLLIEYDFGVSSRDDCEQTEFLVKQSEINNYRLQPIFTGDNIQFFEENVFLTRDDIFSSTLTLKDFFSRQAMNIYDFGKINIMPNGNVYANLYHPVLGNINTNNIYEILHKEIEEGKSWLRIRDQAPCNNCVYQWFCPSPSNHEIAFGRPNLCNLTT